MKNIIIFSLSMIFSHMTTGQASSQSQKIIDKAIKTHGGKNYLKASFSYAFRDHKYKYTRDHGMYVYERYNPKTEIRDILTNTGFERYKKGKKVRLTKKDEAKYAESVNSVNYFAFLPYFLHDDAVYHKYLGQVSIKGEPYNKIEVSFSKEGGGKDHDDIYIYWIHEKKNTVDYLAYSFHVNGGGVRFRSAYNRRKVGQIIFQDYINYKHDKNTAVSQLDELYESGRLKELSRIELIDIRELK